jgi:23S rRNA pseudouridine1911/1915/1917 synthase
MYDASRLRPPDVAEGSVVTVFRVPPEVAGQRLDVFMHGQLHRTSRTRAQAIVRASAYDASGRRLKPNDRVQAEQHILLWRAPWDETPVPVDVPIVYEDEHLLAVSKPALLPVHPTARYHKNTLIKILQASRPDCAFLSLGHRLDRETSGVMLVSKTRECDRALKIQLAERTDIEKTYVAVTWGVPRAPHPPDRGGRGEAAGDGHPGERRSFRVERRLQLDPTSELKVKMRVHDSPEAQYAATEFLVEETRRVGDRTYARVRCSLETGRQHQIRVHLASLGTPVVGDKLYGPDERAFARSADGELTAEDLVMLELPRHALHAARLALNHPMTGRRLALEAPLPIDILDFWDGLAGG